MILHSTRVKVDFYSVQGKVYEDMSEGHLRYKRLQTQQGLSYCM